MLRRPQTGVYSLTGAPSLESTSYGDRMRLESLKNTPLPVSFVVVVSVTIVLFIFFGAWAVSADAEDRDRVLSFAVPGGVSSISATSSQGAGTARDSKVENATDGPNAADTWWGGALLRACPLH